MHISQENHMYEHANDMNRGDGWNRRSRYAADAGDWEAGAYSPYGGWPAPAYSWLSAVRSLVFNVLDQSNMHMGQAQAEVAAAQHARIGIVCQEYALGRQLLNRLRGAAAPAGSELPAEGLPAPRAGQEENFIGVEGPFAIIGLQDGARATAPLEEAPAASDVYLSQTPYWSHAGDSWNGSESWGAAGEPQLGSHDAASAAQVTDCLLYLVRASRGWEPADARWWAQLQALGKPIIPVLLFDVAAPAPETDAMTDVDAHVHDESAQAAQKCAQLIYQQTAVRPLRVNSPHLCRAHGAKPHASIHGQTDVELPADLLRLIDRILEVRPKLAIPLAQSVPGVRRQIVQRIIRRGALLTAALGCDPIPLLDLPLQIALNWKVALQVAAIYGRPSLDVGSREMMGTVGISLALRLAAQQLLKLMPLVGWGLSAGASGASTWLLGRALVRYYEQERLVTPALFVERGLRLLRQRCGRLP